MVTERYSIYIYIYIRVPEARAINSKRKRDGNQRPKGVYSSRGISTGFRPEFGHTRPNDIYYAFWRCVCGRGWVIACVLARVNFSFFDI